MIVVTAGHVDHGKSTLVRLLTGVDPDRLAEERRRGLTIDLGFAFSELPDGTALAVVDVPGHQRFAANMLAGAHAVDVALLVVSARDGWMPQTEEHLMVLEHLGARGGVVALTHVDRVGDAERGAAIAAVRSRLVGTFLGDAAVMPLDGRPGARLDALAAELSRLLGTTAPPPDLGRPRLWVDRAFVLDGLGRVVTGTLTGGAIAVGGRLEVADATGDGDDARAVRRGGGDAAAGTHRIRSLHVNGAAADRADPGSRVALRLAGPGPATRRLRRGVALVRPGQWLTGRHLHVALAPMRGCSPLRARGGYTLVLGTAQWPVELRRPASGAALGGAAGPEVVRLHARSPMGPVAPGDRIVLRDSGTAAAVAGGMVLAVDPTVRRLPPDVLAARLAALRPATTGGGPGPDALARALVAEAGGAMAVIDLGRAVGPVGPVAAPAARGEPEGVVVIGDLALDAGALRRRLAELEEALGCRAEAATATAPDGPADGLDRATGIEVPADDVGRAAAAQLVACGRAEQVDGRLWAAGSGGARRRRLDIARRVVAAVGDSPRSAAALAASAGVSGRVVTDLLRSGELVALGGGLVTSTEARRRWDAAVRRRLQAGPATLAELRDELGLSRREALAVLDATDATGLTMRVGDRRVLRPGREQQEC